VLKVYTHYPLPADSDVGFNCFPISAHLRDSCPDLCEKMSVFGLRLASQETRARSFFLSLSRSKFPNFPLSHINLSPCFATLFKHVLYDDRWRGQTAEDHTHHQRNVSYRGILQAVCPGLVFSLFTSLFKPQPTELVGRLRINKSVASFQEFARDAATQLNSMLLVSSLMMSLCMMSL
jgi:hypothetical protein